MATGLENLKIYILAEELEILIHKITQQFPPEEKYRSIDQINRAASAATSAIAEGYNRHSYKEQIHFLYIAKSEAEETKRNILKSAKKDFY